MLVILTDFLLDAFFIKEQRTITLFVIKDSGVHFHNAGCMKKSKLYRQFKRITKENIKSGRIDMPARNKVSITLHDNNPIFRTEMLV